MGPTCPFDLMFWDICVKGEREGPCPEVFLIFPPYDSQLFTAPHLQLRLSCFQYGYCLPKFAARSSHCRFFRSHFVTCWWSCPSSRRSFSSGWSWLPRCDCAFLGTPICQPQKAAATEGHSYQILYVFALTWTFRSAQIDLQPFWVPLFGNHAKGKVYALQLVPGCCELVPKTESPRRRFLDQWLFGGFHLTMQGNNS